ncbi:MAG: ATP-binding protein [Pseudomonadota bacterium]
MHARLPSPISISVRSGARAPRMALARLMSGLAPLHLDVEEAGTVELVLAEVLNNICEHAYAEAEDAGVIELSCRQGPGGLIFGVTDDGHPMPNGQTPLGMQADLDVDLMDMPEGGFGWFLIQDLAKDVRYERQGGRNHLSLRIAVAVLPPI